MEMNVQYTLNRGWIKDDNENEIGETNFVVSGEFLQKVFNEEYAEEYDSLGDFLDEYEPEDVGERIYRRAIAEGVLVVDFGKCLYDTPKGTTEVFDIVWDTENDGESISQDELNLPSRVEIDGDIDADSIADYLSDTYGYCVESFTISDGADPMFI